MVAERIYIWEKQKACNTENGYGKAYVDTYILEGEKKRGAVLICPGGGYHAVAKREAEPVAVQFNAAGFHAFVLRYRVAPHRYPLSLLDVSLAMSIIRENADKWNIYADKITVCGFSAGGHLAASLGVHWSKPFIREALQIDDGMNRPDAMILCYPVITSGEFAHRGSINNLLGGEADEKLLHEVSLEHHVSEKTPPAFIWHTLNDSIVPAENSLLFANALRKRNIPFELHIYPEGPHGLSLATKETDEENRMVRPHVATWLRLCTEWLETCI